MKNYSVHVNQKDVFRWITAGNMPENASGGETADSLFVFDRRLQLQVETAVKQIEHSASARYVYSVFDIRRAADETESGIILEGTSLLLSGSDISDLLKACRRCILLAVTIGSSADRLIRKAQISSMSDAVILDFCASSAVEELCSRINSDLEREFEEKGFYLTDRFSPGYGDLPLGLQGEICRVLRTDKRLGLTVSAGGMMIPSKSITAVIGIAGRPQPKKSAAVQTAE